MRGAGTVERRNLQSHRALLLVSDAKEGRCLVVFDLDVRAEGSSAVGDGGERVDSQEKSRPRTRTTFAECSSTREEHASARSQRASMLTFFDEMRRHRFLPRGFWHT